MKRSLNLASALYGGALALAFFASCDNEKDLYDPEQAIKNKQAEYAAAFEKMFGKVNPNQDWGFGQSRATRGVNANANQWFTGEGGATPVYEVDPNVTTAERNAVFAYVNQDKGNLTVADQPNWTDYFVTQVWKGNKNELDGKKTPQSTSYPDQNGQTTTIDGASHMDQLEAQLADGTWEHIYNFNNANNGNTVNDVNGNAIVEKMLMVESGTAKFRYNNSQSSFQSEKYIVVKGSDIPGMPAECADYYYVCFDFENGYTAEEAANETTHATINGSYEKKVIKGGDIQIKFSVELDNNSLSTATSDIVAWLNNNQYLWVNGDYSLDANNIENIQTSTSDGSWGTVLTVTGTYPTGEEPTESWETVNINNENFSTSGVYTAETLTAEKVLELKGETAEVQNVNITVSVKGYGTGDKHFDGDNNYTDWIVRISPAKVRSDEINKWRVYAEDLGVIGDWDFNDIVFDVIQNSDNSTDIILQAAGGTLPSTLTIGSQVINVHEAFGVADNVMVNTNNGTAKVEPKKFHFGQTIYPADVKITVNGIEIEAIKGKPAGKFCIPTTGVRWMNERTNIASEYSTFTQYVNDNDRDWWIEFEKK